MYLAHSPIFLWHIGFLLSNNRTIYDRSLWCLGRPFNSLTEMAFGPIQNEKTYSELSPTFFFVTNIDRLIT